MKPFVKWLALLCALCCFWALSAQAQLVVNPYFHILNPSSSLNTCATADVPQATTATGYHIEDMCAGWFTPTDGTPDYFYGCDMSTPIDYGVPANTWSTAPLEDPLYNSSSYPPNIRAYAGIKITDDAFPNDHREYITQLLTSPLQPGHTYAVSFLVHASDTQYFIEQLGCLLTATAPTAANTSNGTDGVLTTTIGDYGIATNTSGWDANSWQYVEIKVTVTGSAKYFLTLGNFQAGIPAGEWHGTGTTAGQAYYFIDNVQVCDPCDIQVHATKVEGTATQCCYDITVISGENACGTFTGFNIKDNDGHVLYHYDDYGYGALSSSNPIRICIDRFDAPTVAIDLLNSAGEVACSQYLPLVCNCQCSTLGNPTPANPPGFSISVQRAGGNCCWNVIATNTGPCDVRALGISLSGTLPPGSMVGGSGSYSFTGGLFTMTGGVLFKTGTTATIGQICIPPSTLDVPIHFDIMKTTGSSCSIGFNAFLTCADECCGQVMSVVKTSTISPDELHCCFTLNVTLAGMHPCIQSIVLQTQSGGVWTTTSTTPAVGTNFSIGPLCVPVGSTQKVRLLFRRASDGLFVCLKEFTLGCEADCCSAITDISAYRVPPYTSCCFRIHGHVQPTQACPIYDYVVQEYTSVTGGGGSWSTITTGVPAVPDNYFESLACLSSNSGTVRIQFRDANGNVVCTRWLTLSCGVPKLEGMIHDEQQSELEAYAVPNPARNETTVHYTVHEKSDTRISLYNALGELMMEVQASSVDIGNRQTPLSTAQLPSGVYYIQVQSGKRMMTIPITVVK